MSERLPRPSYSRIRATVPQPEDLITLAPGTRLVRVHSLGGAHPCAWNQFRSFGPTRSRFDHHPPPPRSHPRRRIAYMTRGPEAFTAALAERFQDDGGGVGPLDASRGRPAVTVFDLSAPITVLDLDGGWVTRAGGNQAISSGPRRPAREWARTIYRAHPGLDGLAYRSSVWGPGDCLALWERSERALPADPLATRTLDDPALLARVAAAALALGTYLV